MTMQAFYPEGIVTQIKAFFSDVHDLTDFYYKLYLLSGLCRHCDGRGYLHTPDQSCPQCRGSGKAGAWNKATSAKHDMS